MKTPSLKERLQEIHDAQRRRLERIASRYTQLDQALDQTDALMATIPTIANAALANENSKNAGNKPRGPRKPR